MSDESEEEIKEEMEIEEPESEELAEGGDGQISEKYRKIIDDGTKKYKLSGMYKEWFLDYASEVILERAVPHIIDGLKPVQRRILHAMKECDDGRLNKVASLVGATMPYHPHGDASIKDALVQLGQKELLIDCQGNWGNILTGDDAAAGRYIEARLTHFAREVVFNSKTTEWTPSYDGRNQEPVNLPVKFPLLLMQGSQGVAVGLACKMLPHNFNELIDASVAYLRGEEFDLYPDFPTGGLADVSAYNRGIRGGRVRVRARIEKISRNQIAITEIPFGNTTSDIIDSILKANERGKIKVKRVDDNTADKVEIVITLPNDVSPDKTIDALYAFTKCEFPISPNSCVIKDKKPQFLGVDEILKFNTDHTRDLLKMELEIKLGELEADWHYTSLEKIFFENKVYKVLENNARTWEKQLKDVLDEMKTYQHLLRKKISMDDIVKLVEKPVRKISRFDIKAVTDKIAAIEKKEKEVQFNLEHLTEYTVKWYLGLKEKYGAKFPRRTEIISFENIEVAKVAANNAKLYVNRAEGFVGTNSKKIEEAEYVCDCSDIDEIIVFLKDGRYTIRQVKEKEFVERNIIHLAVFRRDDKRTTYNVAYRDGRMGNVYVKRFNVTNITRDKWYDVTQGHDMSAILWFTANPNAEEEVIKVYLKPRQKVKKLIFEYDFHDLAIKNRSSMGNILSKNPVQKIVLKSVGASSIGGKKMWFDWDICRLNEDSHGEYLGEFTGNETILVICKDGTFYTTNIDLSNRYPGEILKVEILDTDKVWSALYWDGSASSTYIKRFTFEKSDNTIQPFISPEAGSRFIDISEDAYPRLLLTFPTGGRKERDPETVDVEQFIGVKSFRAKGRKVTYLDTESVVFTDPLVKEEPEPQVIGMSDDFSVPEGNEDAPAASSETSGDVKTDDAVTVDMTDTRFFSNPDDEEPTLF